MRCLRPSCSRPLAVAPSVLVSLALLATLACRRETHDPPTPAPLAAFDGVEVAGCAAFLAGPACRVGGDRTVRIFVPAGATAIAIAVDGRVVERADGSGADGARLTVKVPPGASSLTVTAGTAIDRRFTLRLDDAPAPPSWLDEARAARRRGAFDDAARTLDGAERSTDAHDDRLAADLATQRAALALARGDDDAAMTAFARSSELHAAAGEISAASTDENGRAYFFTQAKRFADARGSLDRLARLAVDYPEGRVFHAYQAGVLAMEAGDLRAALESLEDARAHAERLGMDRVARDARQSYAIALLCIGRLDEALAILGSLDATAGDDPATLCERAGVKLNLGWAALLARDAPFARRDAIVDPARPLQEAEAAYRSCSDPAALGTARVNLAWARLQDGDVARARATLHAAREAPAVLEPLDAFFARDLDGRIALAAGDTRAALAAYDALASRASGLSPIDEEGAAEGRATALERAGDRVGALAAIRRAGAQLDEAARAIPLGEGRGAFWWTRARVARREVRLLLDLGRDAEALDAVRSARAHVAADAARVARVASLGGEARGRWEAALAEYRRGREALVAQARDDWGVSAAALARVVPARRARDVELRAGLDAAAAQVFPAAPHARPPLAAGDDVALVWFPLDGDWAAFAIAHGALHAARVAAPTDPARIAEATPALVAWAAPYLAGAAHARLVPSGPLRDVDLASVAVDGAPLLARVVLEYPLDTIAAPPDAVDRPALVVADPTLTLPAARREALVLAAVADTGRGAGVLVGAAATRARVLADLAGAGAFYFSGHAAYAGVDGWESALLLAGRERLGVADVLALPRAPSLVVLSGCETGRDGAQGGASGLGLADAFLAIGSRAVLASVRRVDDATTERLMRALVAALAIVPDDPSAALRRAQLDLHAADPAADWTAFRAFVP